MNVNMKQLLESGVHFGHQTRRWNPKMAKYIFGERNGIYIIDLKKTVKLLKEAYDFTRDTVAAGGNILFVGTKKQAQESVYEEARRAGMPYVTYRWLGGMLTNFVTIRRSVDRLRNIQRLEEDGTINQRGKKERLMLSREKEKLLRALGGIADMTGLPSAIFVSDCRKEHIAVLEARKLKVPVIGIVDTNCDPDLVDYVIPGNDDAIRAVRLITSKISDAALEGKQILLEGGAPQGEPAAEGVPAEAALPSTDDVLHLEGSALPVAQAGDGDAALATSADDDGQQA